MHARCCNARCGKSLCGTVYIEVESPAAQAFFVKTTGREEAYRYMHDQDFKYAMDDLTRINIGAKYTYEEIIGNSFISYKFRQICRQIFETEVASDTTIESHLYYLSTTSQSYLAYERLKTKATVLVPDSTKKQEDGSPQYHQRTLKISQLVLLSPEQKQQMGMIIQEIEISKLGLSMLVI